MSQNSDYPLLTFENQSQWEDWLEVHHAEAQGIWAKMAKKGSGIPSITYAELVEAALCYGWIDGQSKSIDEQYWMQKFTPRKPNSKWSKINREKVEGLIAAGRMRPAGLQQVEKAKADGRWDAAYDPPSKASVPEDFQRELNQHPQAQEFFNTLNSTNRYAILYRIQTAKKPETRAARIQKIIEMLLAQQKFYP